MDNSKQSRSAQRLRKRLAASGDPLRMYLNDALYHAQVDYTCQLLDVVDEAADPATAGAITDLICERLAGDGASEAAVRIREFQVAAEFAAGRMSRDIALSLTRSYDSVISAYARGLTRPLDKG